MLVRVAVLAPVRGLFTYSVPEELAPRVAPGVRVEVPFGRRSLSAFVVEPTDRAPEGIAPKVISGVVDEPQIFPPALFRFLLWTADYYLHPPGEVLKTALPPKGAGGTREAKGAAVQEAEAPKRLTDDQSAATAAIRGALDRREFRAFLLHGVTGSGKTEVYLDAIARALELGRSAVVLVPEIGLTPQLEQRFRARFGDLVAVLHSGQTQGRRARDWRRLREGAARVALGVRAAVFAPVDPLGLVVVDEEHDPSFKQEDRLCYHARDMAVARAREAGCPVVLGSATPSLESHANAAAGRYEKLSLPVRIDDRPLPEVAMIDLRGAPPGLLHETLLRELGETLLRGEQAILFLNRRGHAGCLSCRACGHVETCRQCSVSLTLHKARGRLLCHYCGFSRAVPARCPVCKGEMIPLGAGTEKVEEEVVRLFPTARVARLDADVGAPVRLARTLRAFRDRELDVLVGTQLVAKGHDFPSVTLVGAVLADSGLNLPDFRASERSFQLLVQVAGRAGRGRAKGRVLVQTYHPDHPALVHVARHDYLAFAEAELARRRAVGWPPWSRLCAVRVDAKNPEAAERAARALGRIAEGKVIAGKLRVTVLGPSLAPLERLRGRTRWQLLLRAAARPALREVTVALQEAAADLGPVRVVFDVDPVGMM
ncbi:MAG TPA: primosomal protein N' [Myxococcales bacterium]|nr:primosomal protein N' [Myxococcales bacterium]